MTPKSIESDLKDLAHKLRIHSIQSTDATNSGHPTSCSSIAEIMSVLFFNIMKYNVQQPLNPNNDRFILSKGHAAPILYSAWAEAGLFPIDKLLTLRKFTSDLEGHPTPRLNFVDIATGSLGQGLGVACGMAYSAKYIESSSYRVFCVLGDGECAEGSVWEAAAFGGNCKLNNLVVIVDINSLGQSDFTALAYDLDTYKKRFESFGFCCKIVDGHNIKELILAFNEAETCKIAPTVILAKTIKGAFFENIEGKINWHGKALGVLSEKIINNLENLIVNKNVNGTDLIKNTIKPICNLIPITTMPSVELIQPPNYTIGTDFATRAAGGFGLVKIGKNCDRIVVIDGDVKNSTFTDKFKSEFPSRFIDCFIAEQNMVSIATGLATRNRFIPFLSTFSAFLSRAHDQIRMAAISMIKLKIIGTHCGVSIGEDGGSQMGLEDIGMFRCLPESVVLYPSDAVSAERAVELAANLPHLVYIRMSRPAMPTLYSPVETFEVGKFKIVHQSTSDRILIIGGGVTLIESLKAAKSLANSNINVRVLDIFSVKPLDVEGLIKNASECNNLVLTVEDHYQEGGIGEAISSALSHLGKFRIHMVYVDRLPRSGKPMECMAQFGITSDKIKEKVESLI